MVYMLRTVLIMCWFNVLSLSVVDNDIIVDKTFLLRLGPGFESLGVLGVRGVISLVIELIYNMIDNK